MIFSMYCLEIDLVCSSVAKSKYYDILNIDSGVQDTKILLEANYKAIKKRENILKIIEDLKPRNYPESFNKIKNAFIENVVTNKEYRGKGFASECLNYAKDIAIQNDCYKMMLLTGTKNESTLNFYKNAGYNSEDKIAFIQWLA